MKIILMIMLNFTGVAVVGCWKSKVENEVVEVVKIEKKGEERLNSVLPVEYTAKNISDFTLFNEPSIGAGLASSKRKAGSKPGELFWLYLVKTVCEEKYTGLEARIKVLKKALELDDVTRIKTEYLRISRFGKAPADYSFLVYILAHENGVEGVDPNRASSLGADVLGEGEADRLIYSELYLDYFKENVIPKIFKN